MFFALVSDARTLTLFVFACVLFLQLGNVFFHTGTSTFGMDLVVRASGDISLTANGDIDVNKASGTVTLHAEYDCYNTTGGSNSGVVTIGDGSTLTASGTGTTTVNVYGGDVVIGTTSGTVTAANTGTINFVEKCDFANSIAVGGDYTDRISGTWRMQLINSELARLTSTEVTFTSDLGNVHVTDVIQAGNMSTVTGRVTLTATSGSLTFESGAHGATGVGSSFVALTATGHTGMNLNQDVATTNGDMSLTFNTGGLAAAVNVDIKTTGGNLAFASSGNQNVTFASLPASVQVLSGSSSLNLNFGGHFVVNRHSSTRNMFTLYVGDTLTCTSGTKGLVLEGASSNGAILKVEVGDMVFDTGGSSCDIDTQKDGNAHSSDYLWFLPTCSQVVSTAKTCSMSLGALATSRGTNFSLTDAELDLINMGGTGTLIFGDQNAANTPIPSTSATTVVEEIHVETISLAATVAGTVYMISNRHALTVCAFCFFKNPLDWLPSFQSTFRDFCFWFAFVFSFC